MTAFDVERLRAEFPILGRSFDGIPLHYLDNAATSQTPLAVLDAVRRHETENRANVLRGIHRLAEAATAAYENARQTVARYLNARSPAEIIFCSGTTAAINLVARTLGERFVAGEEVAVSHLEHHSNILPWQLLRDRRGVAVTVIDVTPDGRIDVAHLERILTKRTRLVAITHVSNVTGAVTDMAAVVVAARRVGALVLVDGAQRAPHGPIDVQALDVDFYAFSGHKVYGPNGIGVLWGRRALLDAMPPFLGGGEMIKTVTFERSTYADVPHRFEAGTPPIAQAVGLGAALDWVIKLDSAMVESHLTGLTERILVGLQDVDRGRNIIRVIGPTGLQARMPVVSFSVAGAHPHDICQLLDRYGCALRGGHHCAQPLMDRFDVAGTTRASLAPYNNREDVDAFIAGLDKALKKLL
ncbi:MAG: SufS family cysteine desulfurase [Alphaproteobacteria bacterium]|nr:SufS family cysteine desulfurase [Alphaproteobacteria bacterium]